MVICSRCGGLSDTGFICTACEEAFLKETILGKAQNEEIEQPPLEAQHQPTRSNNT